ncbi:MAG: hypothetical protein L3J10_01800 [Sulfurimonas sp.]|nr:hypothetical protein [Sulfurimonas sp.]
MKKIIFILFFSLSISNAKVSAINTENCTLEQAQEIDIYFEGYKTNFKVGIVGRFKDITYIKNSDGAENILELLKNYKIIIDKKSVYTAQKEVNENLLKYFFNILEGDNIEATIIDLKPINFKEVNESLNNKQKSRRNKIVIEKYNYDEGDIVLEVNMNGIKKNVNMKYYTKKDILYSTGKLNLLEFNASEALYSLNKACFNQHLGKTWSDINIYFSIKTKKVCKKKVEL